MATKKHKGLSTGAAMGIGAGVLATAAAAYFFFGPEGKKNRTKLKGWMIRMKGDIIEKMENAKDLTESAYHHIVDAVATTYAKEKGIGKEAVMAFADTLKNQWKGFAKEMKGTKKAAKKTVKKAAKKTAKKAS